MRHRRRRLAVVLLTTALLAGSTAATAADTPLPRAWPFVGTEFRIGAGSSWGSDVAYAPGGDYLVAWEDTFFPSPWGEIVGQRITTAGTLAGPQVPVATGPPNATQAQVAYNSKADYFLVVWVDTRINTAPGVYGRRISSAGVPLGSDFAISGPDAVISIYDTPGLAYNSAANQFLVVWTDGRNDATRGGDIFGRRVSAAGAVLGGDFLISGPGADEDDYSPAVEYSAGANQWLVVWADSRDYGERGEDIYGRRVRAMGGLAKSDFRVSSRSGLKGEGVPAIAYNPDADEFLVVWLDRRLGSRDIFGQRVPGIGAKIGGNFRISRGAGDEGGPSAAYNPDAGQYLVAWHDSRNDATRGGDIFGRRVSAAGTPLDKDFRICGAADKGHDSSPDVAFGDGDYLVVWSSYRADWETRGVRIDGSASG